MIAQENYDAHYHYDSAYQIREESAQTEIIEHTGPDACQHLSEERSADHQPTELDHDDADRRTLDESQAEEQEDDED